MLELIQCAAHPPHCTRRTSFLTWQEVSLPQSQLDGAKVSGVEVFCICLNGNHPLGFSLAQALIKPLHSLLQLGLSRRGTRTNKHLSSERAVGGKGLAGSSRSRPNAFGVRDIELGEIPRRT